MELGKHLHELSRHRLAFAACLLLALYAALSVSYRIGLAPPALDPRQVEIASATTEVLVDTPLSTVLDLRQGATDIEAMTNRATLIGNVMTSPPVLAFIGERAQVSPDRIRVQPPLTPDFPRPLAEAGSQPKVSDIVRSPDEYRINVQVNPSVPVIKLFVQAPSPEAAAGLANGAVDGLRDYIRTVAQRQGTRPSSQVRLTQLGRATGTTINDGVRLQLSILTFLAVFGLAAGAVLFVSRVRRGFAEADRQGREPRDPPAGAGPGPAPPSPGATPQEGERAAQRADAALR